MVPTRRSVTASARGRFGGPARRRLGGPARRWGRAAGGLIAACHPLPAVAVTVLATGLAAAWTLLPAGASLPSLPSLPARLAGGPRFGPAAVIGLVALTVLVGQLAIGWCDDAVDVAKDRAGGRRDKPIVAGRVSRRAVGVAAAAAAALSIPLSLANGAAAGAAHLVVVVAGLAYAVRLERTVVSFVPYVVAFGALPAYVRLAVGLGLEPSEAWPAVLAGALLGLGGHLANVLPDLEADRAYGILGLPQRLGARTVRILAPLPGALATVVLAAASPSPYAWAAAGVATLLALGASVARLQGRAPFLVTLATAALALAVLALTGV